jgi:hypothetical protein
MDNESLKNNRITPEMQGRFFVGSVLVRIDLGIAILKFMAANEESWHTRVDLALKTSGKVVNVGCIISMFKTAGLLEGRTQSSCILEEYRVIQPIVTVYDVYKAFHGKLDSSQFGLNLRPVIIQWIMAMKGEIVYLS